MAKVLRRTLVLLIPALGVAAAAWYLTRPRPVVVRVAALGRGTVRASVANTRAGTVRARRRARLAPPIGGQVAVLGVKEGDRVEKDQVLLELWNEDLKAELQLARSESRRAAALAEEASARAELASRDANRLLELQAAKVASDERVEEAVFGAKALQAAQRAAEAQAQVQQDRVAVVAAELAKTVLKAPFAGVVAEVHPELGEFVTPSPTGIPTQPAIDLIDPASVYVSAPIDEVDAASVRVGMDVRVTLDAFRDRAFAGRVRRIAPYVLDREKQARTVDVEVDLVEPPPEVPLLPGYSADVEIVLTVRADVLRVPTEAVLEGSRVLVVDPASEVAGERGFEPGISSWEYTEVASGLREGELVVTSLDREGVRDGALVEVEDSGVGPAAGDGRGRVTTEGGR